MIKQSALAALLCLSCSAFAASGLGDMLPYVLRNGAADSVVEIARIKHLDITNLPQCRLDVANDFYSAVTDTSNYTFAMLTDSSTSLAPMSSLAPEVFTAAYDVLNHITATYGEKSLQCAQSAIASVTQTAGAADCQALLTELRASTVTTFMKMGAVTAAITRSIGRHCSIKR